MTSYHKILQRQIGKYLEQDVKICPGLDKLFHIISDTYEHFEKHGELLERSMNLSSKELFESNDELRNAYKRQEIVLERLKQAIADLKIHELSDPAQEVGENNLIAMVDLLREKIRLTKRFEKELKVSGLRFQAILENTTDVIWSVDENLRLNTFNSFFRQKSMTRYNIKPELGDRISDIVPRDEYRELEMFLQKAKEGERFTIEEVDQKGNTPRYFETSFNPIREENKVNGVSVFSRDITTRKEQEKSKTQILNELQSVNEELQQIAYITSHDLKTPLRSIGSIASWLKADYQHHFDELGQDQINILLNRVDRLYSLIDGISLYMSLSPLDERERQLVSIDKVVLKIIRGIDAPENIIIKAVRPLPEIRGIKNHIALVFEQLIKNAAFFMGKKEGEILIDFRQIEQDIEFSVSDNGQGIDEKYHQKIFKIFQTLKPKDELESNGIGLAIVKKIVKMHGGDIRVDSVSGRGAAFSFNFNY